MMKPPSVLNCLNRHSLLFLAYLIGVIVVSFVHDIGALLVGLMIVMIMSWSSLRLLIKRTLYVILFFNLSVSIGYVVMMMIQHSDTWLVLLRLNVRVLLLTLMSVSVIHHINFYQAFCCSKSLTHLMILMQSQIATFIRAKDDFQMAFMSRSLAQPTLRDRYLMTTAMIAWLFDKAFFASREIASALKSRGFFND